MVIKIQKGSKAGLTSNKGSCRDLAYYINHEDSFRILDGLAPLPYTTPDGIEVSTEEVIKNIDLNGKGLHQNECKFYHMIISPSKEEIIAMGSDDRSVYENALTYLKPFTDTYAELFHRDGVEDSSDVVIYWKPHFTRGEDDELQFHIHGIVSRNSAGKDGKKRKISPLTNHTDTTSGPVKGGYDRSELCSRAEKLFDKLFNYERKVAESFEYQHAMKHGTLEEKKEQTERLVAEDEESISAAIAAGIERRRNNKQTKSDVEQLDNILEGITLEDAFGWAELKNNMESILQEVHNSLEFELALGGQGCTCKPRVSSDGVEELEFIKYGRKIGSFELFGEKGNQKLLAKWEVMTGQKPAFKTRAEREVKKVQEAEQKRSHRGRSLGR